MGPRDAAICRELTKLHEEVRRGPLAALAETALELETRGEFVLVIGPPGRQEHTMESDQLDALLAIALAEGSLKDAVAQAVEASGRPRREVYARALELAHANDGDERLTRKARRGRRRPRSAFAPSAPASRRKAAPPRS